MTLRLIHTSDWQIGKVFRFVDIETMGLLQEARLRTIARLGELAGKHAASHVLVAGDVCDMEALSPRSLNSAVADIFVIDHLIRNAGVASSSLAGGTNSFSSLTVGSAEKIVLGFEGGND